MNFNAVSWNVMAPVAPPLRFSGQTERMERIPRAIRTHLDPLGYVDVLLVQESIVDSQHQVLSSGMKEIGFLHETRPLQGSLKDLKFVRGGVVLFSRWPIVDQHQVIFDGLCDREDCLAAKGAVHAVIQKGPHRVHVVGVHLQAWGTPKSIQVRRGQVAHIKRMIQGLQIPAQEPIILLGDWNVDSYAEQQQLDSMMDMLQAKLLPMHRLSHAFSSDPEGNQLVGMDDGSAYSSDAFPGGCYSSYVSNMNCACCPKEMLDHVCYMPDHKSPDLDQSWFRVVPAKAPAFTVKVSVSVKRTITDLSDHYPILAHLVFPDLSPVEIHNKDLTAEELKVKPKLRNMLPYVAVTGMFLIVALIIGLTLYFSLKK